MRMLETSVTFDQLQSAEITSLELVAHRAQVIELKHRSLILRNSAEGVVEDDSHLYMGTGKTSGLLMVMPTLEDFVAQELQKESSATKERRKMRESCGLARPTLPAPRK